MATSCKLLFFLLPSFISIYCIKKKLNLKQKKKKLKAKLPNLKLKLHYIYTNQSVY